MNNRHIMDFFKDLHKATLYVWSSYGVKACIYFTQANFMRVQAEYSTQDLIFNYWFLQCHPYNLVTKAF